MSEELMSCQDSQYGQPPIIVSKTCGLAFDHSSGQYGTTTGG